MLRLLDPNSRSRAESYTRQSVYKDVTDRRTTEELRGGESLGGRTRKEKKKRGLNLVLRVKYLF
jgi:hypothetical protein